jgi:signal transduction histidine kinase
MEAGGLSASVAGEDGPVCLTERTRAGMIRLWLPTVPEGLSKAEWSTLPALLQNGKAWDAESGPFYISLGQRIYVVRPVDVPVLPSQMNVYAAVPLNESLILATQQQFPQIKANVQVFSVTDLASAKGWQESLESIAPLSEHMTRLPVVGDSKGKTESYVYYRKLFNLKHEMIGVLVASLPTSIKHHMLAQYYEGLRLIILASIVVTVLLALVAARTITKPLLRLIAHLNATDPKKGLQAPVSVRGVDEINQLSQAYTRLIDAIRTDHQLRDEFVATLTHDLKVPLLAEKQTLTYLGNQVYGLLSSEQITVVSAMQSTNRTMLDLVNSILSVYRYEDGQTDLQVEPTNLVDLVRQTVRELEPLMVDKAIACKMEFPTSDVTVKVDAHEIKRVLHNIIGNAIANTARKGTITCSLLQPPSSGNAWPIPVSQFPHASIKHPPPSKGFVLLSIQDSGVGFSPEGLAHVFQRFASNRNRNPMALGLGLYNCAQVIEAHHGMVWIESEEGQGTAVNLLLPGKLQAASNNSEKAAHASA